MKSIKTIFFCLAAVLTFAGCNKPEKVNPDVDNKGSIIGQWHLVSWSNTLSAADIYLSFNKEGKFNIYQRLYEPTYSHYDGTYNLNGNKLTGSYSDGTAWGSPVYTVEFSDNGTILTLTGTAENDVAVYVKESIPDYVLSGEMTTKLAIEDMENEPRAL